jgi:hypothetical protein
LEIDFNFFSQKENTDWCAFQPGCKKPSKRELVMPFTIPYHLRGLHENLLRKDYIPTELLDLDPSSCPHTKQLHDDDVWFLAALSAARDSDG